MRATPSESTPKLTHTPICDCGKYETLLESNQNVVEPGRLELPSATTLRIRFLQLSRLSDCPHELPLPLCGDCPRCTILDNELSILFLG